MSLFKQTTVCYDMRNVSDHITLASFIRIYHLWQSLILYNIVNRGCWFLFGTWSQLWCVHRGVLVCPALNVVLCILGFVFAVFTFCILDMDNLYTYTSIQSLDPPDNPVTVYPNNEGLWILRDPITKNYEFIFELYDYIYM